MVIYDTGITVKWVLKNMSFKKKSYIIFNIGITYAYFTSKDGQFLLSHQEMLLIHDVRYYKIILASTETSKKNKTWFNCAV